LFGIFVFLLVVFDFICTFATDNNLMHIKLIFVI